MNLTPAEIIKRIRRIEIKTRKLVNESLAGEYHSLFKGRGMEFSEVREYQMGDDIRTIDWNVTARMGSPFVKQFVEERELTVYLLFDASASGLYGSFGRSKREMTAEIAALLAFSAILNNDKVGLILFSDDVETYIPPKKGRNHVLRLIREILYFEPKGRGSNLKGALEFLGRVATKRSVVFLLSDFYAPDYSRPLTILNKKHDIVGLAVRDTLELDPPSTGLIAVRDLESGREALLDFGSQKVRRAFRERMERVIGMTRKVMRDADVDLLELDASREFEKPLTRFFAERAKRIRM